MDGARHIDYYSQVVSMGDETLAGWSRHEGWTQDDQVDSLGKVVYEITICLKKQKPGRLIAVRGTPSSAISDFTWSM